MSVALLVRSIDWMVVDQCDQCKNIGCFACDGLPSENEKDAKPNNSSQLIVSRFLNHGYEVSVRVFL